MQLGWGGYWAWDPVENASLLPWLTGTALLHAAILQLRRGMFRGWTAGLVAGSFFLCVFGTYLTRSGVIQSVHSFPESPIGKFFLAFLVLIALVSAVVIFVRRGMLKAERPIEDLLSREGMFLAGCVLLTAMTVVTLVGTIFPLLSASSGGTPVTVGPPFYNKVILPMALVLAGIMATGPVLGSGAGALQRAAGKLVMMAVGGVAVAGFLWLIGYGALWAVAAAFVVAFIAMGVVIDVVVSLREGRILSRFRHWGAQVAHLGLAAMVAGIAGSSVYRVTENVELKPGAGSATVGDYSFSLSEVKEALRPNHMAVVGKLIVKRRGGEVSLLQPEIRYFDKSAEQPASVVGIQFGVLRDVYVTMAGCDGVKLGMGDDGKVHMFGEVTAAAFQVFINPLVNWIWVGGGLLTLGGLMCLVSRGPKAPVAAPVPVEEEAAKVAAKGTLRERRRATAGVVGAAVLLGLTSGAMGQNKLEPRGSLDAVKVVTPAGQGGAQTQPSMPAGHPALGGGGGMMEHPKSPENKTGALRVLVSNGTKGGTSVEKDAVTVTLLSRGEAIKTYKAVVEKGVVELHDLPLEPAFQPVISVMHGGAEQQMVGPPMHKYQPAVEVEMAVYEVTTQRPAWTSGMRHITAKAVDVNGQVGVNVVEVMGAYNPLDRAWAGEEVGGSKRTVAVTLPAGAQDVEFGQGMLEAGAKVVDGTIVRGGTMLPGPSQMVFGYTLMAKEGRATLSFVAPAPTTLFALYVPGSWKVEKVDGLEVGKASGTNGDAGSRLLKARGLKAGQVVSVELSGITVPVVKPDVVPTLPDKGGLMLPGSKKMEMKR
jgi:c-type cytochrome biogenesis protein CcmF